MINCLLNQSCRQEKVEYLLIDNNSSDRILSTLQNIAENSPMNIRIFSENNIQSCYIGRNQAIRNITSDHQIIVFTDAECRTKPSWLEELIKLTNL
ncbi:glycosyltransferase family 2 protein [Anabaena sp. FACHB-1237]|nr:glycosyltransferase family 2 protein [Anabaena sp. FACHB-1237]